MPGFVDENKEKALSFNRRRSPLATSVQKTLNMVSTGGSNNSSNESSSSSSSSSSSKGSSSSSTDRAGGSSCGRTSSKLLNDLDEVGASLLFYQIIAVYMRTVGSMVRHLGLYYLLVVRQFYPISMCLPMERLIVLLWI